MNRGSNHTGEWLVSPELSGQTICAAVRKLAGSLSWSDVRTLLTARQLTLNGSLCLDESRRVNEGDELVVCPHPLPRLPDDRDVTIRHIDATIVVIEKPAGMMSLRHVAEVNWSEERRNLVPSADEVVLRAIGRLEQYERDPSSFSAKRRRRIARSVHRIDRDTSGLLVFARTTEAQRNLIEQFSQHTVERVYEAIVFGVPGSGTISSRLVRNRGDGRRGSTLRESDGKHAVTHFQTLESFGEFSRVECRLETGRTHQIRIHLAEAGHPVCGDSIYRGPLNGTETIDRSNSPRLALHARVLEFKHPKSSERVRFEADVPRDIEELITRFRKDAGA